MLARDEKALGRKLQHVVKWMQIFFNGVLERGGPQVEAFLASDPSAEAIAAKKEETRDRIRRAQTLLTSSVDKQALRWAGLFQNMDQRYAKAMSQMQASLEESLLLVDNMRSGDAAMEKQILLKLASAERLFSKVWWEEQVKLNAATLRNHMDAVRAEVLDILGLEADENSFRDFRAPSEAEQDALMITSDAAFARKAYRKDEAFRVFLASYMATRTTPAVETQSPKKKQTHSVQAHGDGYIEGVAEAHGSATGSMDLAAGKANFAAEGAMFLGVRAHGNGHVAVGNVRAAAEGTVEAGISAKGSANGQLDWKAGTVDLGAEGSVFAGAKAEGSAQLNVASYGTAEVSGAVGVGFGLQGQARAGCRKGKCKIKFGLGVFCGVGANVSLSLTVDFVGLLKKAARGFKKALGKIKKVLRKLTEAVQKLAMISESKEKSGRKKSESGNEEDSFWKRF